MKKIFIIVFLSLLCGRASTAIAQVGIKTNLLGWTTASPNLSLEWGIGKKATLNISGSFNPFRFSDGKQRKYWLVQPEYRYWFCEKFNGHFLGFHVLGGEYNLAKVRMPFGLYKGLRDTRYQGWGIGGGIAYGYQWLLSKHWGLEATIGVGYIYSEYDRFPCTNCGKKIESATKHYFGPTKAAISLIYLL
ncbi:hypothetical protein CE91St19_31900 [Odoribacter laneus]|jgi:hypothetical protein|uniref:DUF3575 domain-containing protein n=1 Tax=Odoribacter laneus YIT 12061 TaxID=742817 RepID=H1DFS7_9BACT|nr:DUF3575 domain-containing protein [Odoribacter laneus]EHP48750.1 hypothetical protein HMPREF9449_01113 [Odoribacter laneus YIT 12061]MBS1444967.1 DUF3575 domain-containing protein [Odoribacter sp.]GKI23788.1 hypothetical protein CE91St19_31900 [Odoribacter laneus]GKI24369.1 hypothetical protein CE91St20_05060 [Odoribacter laneus]